MGFGSTVNMNSLNNSKFSGQSNSLSASLQNFIFDVSSTADKFFDNTKQWFLLNNMPTGQNFKFNWSWLTEKAKKWSKLITTLSLLASHGHLKETLLLAFSPKYKIGNDA